MSSSNGQDQLTLTPGSLSPAAVAALETLRRQYFALVAPYMLRIPGSDVLATAAAQEFLVDRLLEGPLPQPEAGYARGFWRRVLPVIEAGVRAIDDDDEAAVDERIYETVAGLMAAPSTNAEGAPAQSHKTFLYDLPNNAGERSVTLLEEQVAVQAGTTGLRTWTAALHLAHHCIYSQDKLFGSIEVPPIVEIGAGTGFLSIVLAQLGADVIATDLGGDEEDEEGEVRRTPLARLKANIELNTSSSLHHPPTARPLDWNLARAPASERGENWLKCAAPAQSGSQRTVLAADVIYDPEIVPLLVDTIRELLQPWQAAASSDNDSASTGREPVAIIAATVRNEQTFALFLARCKAQNLDTVLLQLAPMDSQNPTFWDTALDAGTRVEIVRIKRSA